ncbi:MAG: zinc ribbon domain-containing protein [Mucinivorans sp.]
MEKITCPYCGEEIAQGVIKCEHCGEKLEEVAVSSQQKSQNNYPPAEVKETSKHEGIGIACALAIFFVVVSFLQYIGSTIDLDNIDKSSKLTRYVNFVNLIPEWVVFCAIFAITIYILIMLRKHYIAKKTIFTQYIALSIISASILLVNMILDDDNAGMMTLSMRFAVVFMIYDIIIGVKILRNYINSTLLGISLIICTLISFITEAIMFTAQNLTREEDFIINAIDSAVVVILLLVIKHYFKYAPAIAEPSNFKTAQATQREGDGSQKKGIFSWVIFGVVIVFLLSSTLFIKNSDETHSDIPAAIEEFKPWVAETYLPREVQENIFKSFIHEKFQIKSLPIKYIGNYDDDESGDASWGEVKIYYALAEVVLNNITIYSPEKLFLRTDIKDKVWQFVDNGASGWDILYERLESFYGYDPSAITYYLELLSKDKNQVFRNVIAIIEDITPIINELNGTVELVDWSIDSEFETYTIYAAIYKVNDIYVLCSVLEREDGGAEIQVVEKSKMLLDLQ